MRREGVCSVKICTLVTFHEAPPLEQRTQRIHVRLTQRGKCSMPLEVCPSR